MWGSKRWFDILRTRVLWTLPRYTASVGPFSCIKSERHKQIEMRSDEVRG